MWIFLRLCPGLFTQAYADPQKVSQILPMLSLLQADPGAKSLWEIDLRPVNIRRARD